MRNMTSSLMTAALAIALCVSAPLMAQEAQKGKAHDRPVFADCDLNGNGTIAKDEFYKARSERIAKRVQEGRQMKNLDKAPSFEDIDANGDGGISPDEFSAHQARHQGEGSNG